MSASQPSSSSSSTMTLAAENFQNFHTSVQSSALKATKASATLPADISFYKSIDPDLANDVDVLGKRVLSLVGALLGLVDTKGKGKAKEVAVAGDDVVDDFHNTVVDSMDVLLERTDICLDEFSGRLKRPTVPAVAASTIAKSKTAPPKTNEPKGYLPPSLQHASSLAKPQTLFPTKPDNSDVFFKPHSKLTHKYNAKVPLGYVLQKEDLVDQYVRDDDEKDTLISSHPYYYETTHLGYPKHVYEPPSEAVAPPPLSSDACSYVTTSDGFTELLEHLSSPQVKDLAVDLEHHSYRTYRGFLCLMQITTRGNGDGNSPHDFIVDLLVPEIRARMPELNAIFTDSSKIKVFHGAESDIVWLQQDFGVYVVGLFDTFHASKLLELPRHSLSTLLSLYADFTPDKKYQQADWRIRPLPQEMFEYAQSDTHWLLYIYDCVRSALLDKGKSRGNSRSGSPVETDPATTAKGDDGLSLLRETLYRSSLTSLRIYSPETYDAARGSGPGGWDTLAKKWNKGALVYLPGDSTPSKDGISTTDNVPVYRVQRNVYRAVHAWRDRASREEDESTRYVLPNHFLFTLAETHPADMAALLGIFRNNVPAIIKKRAKELLDVIKDAVKKALVLEEAAKLKKDAEVKVEEKMVAIADAMQVDEQNVSTGADSSEASKQQKLWGLKSSPSVAAPTSSLFTTSTSKSSASSQPSTSKTQISATSSSLFGDVLSKHSSGTPTTSTSTSLPKNNPTFQALVARINSTLVIAPSIPRILADSVPKTSTTTTTVTSTTTTTTVATTAIETTAEHDPAIGMQIDGQPIAYVPASQRMGNTSTIKTMEDMGPIVIVGQKKSGGAGNKKKRKLQAQSSKEPSGTPDADVPAGDATGKSAPSTSANAKSKKRKSSSMEPGTGEDQEEETFDFAAAPNVLDTSRSRAKKQKRDEKADKKAKKKATNFYGDFPAPPKARNEVKSGNISTTYKP